jgi:hypothetical protein
MAITVHSSDCECFRCKALSIGFSFRGGGGYTRQSFHETTNREVVDEMKRVSAEEGREIEKV